MLDEQTGRAVCELLDSVGEALAHLRLSENEELPKELGTRHRAGIGVSETNNVLTIIVSEETGVISTAYRGELTRYYDSEMLTDKLREFYGLKSIADAPKKKTKRGRSRKGAQE